MSNATERRTIEAQSRLPQTVQNCAGEIIPGYELEERIGAGGYGEVWRAKAPGGLLKAVKIVYGTMTERHATVELKSLERIKTVRHPFILTLERIEVVDGRLVTVTELAEMSLRDYFEETTRTGDPGIERERLIRYMHDVADALDYMYDQHSLAHLDIKPENLLIIGDHVKVADFGLTKDLRDASLSAVAGMTPVYAAPEVFEGKPGRHSDQYSLACVYQYLLTGQPPFRGRTSAQLISQHLHSAPDFSLLPGTDHSALTQALAKSPGRRFESCRAFIRALEDVGRIQLNASVAPVKDVEPKTRPRPLYETDSESGSEEESCSPRFLEPTSLEDVNFDARPALVVALGGVAGRLLVSLKRRLAERSDTVDLPPIRMLAVDTDESSVFETMYGQGDHGLTSRETLPTPLKRSSAYRRKFKRLLEWIARRWLFNIPRSKKTEGIRALGRLAFVDHYAEICAAFQRSLAEIVTQGPQYDETAASDADSRSERPNVFVISTVGGGTGSGMVIDAAYALRHQLRQMRLAEAAVTGVFLQDESGNSSNTSLEVANSLAFLKELEHFQRVGHYPENHDAGIPEASFLAPFDTSYFVRLDQETNEHTGNSHSEVTEYLLRSLAGRSAAVFDFLRAKQAEKQTGPRLSSFAATVVGGDDAKTGRDSPHTQELHKRIPKTRGAARLLVATKDDTAGAFNDIKTECGQSPTVFRDEDPRTFLCDEIEDIPYRDVVSILRSTAQESSEIADMLTTRIDVDWGH